MRRTPSTAAPPNWSPPNWPPPPKPPSKPPPYCTQRNCKGDERGAVSRCRTPAPRQSCWNTINTRVSPLRSSSRARWEAHAARDRIQGRADGALNSRAPCRSKMGCRWRRARREFARRGAKCECGVSVSLEKFSACSQSVSQLFHGAAPRSPQSFHFVTEDTGPAYTLMQILQHRSRAPAPCALDRWTPLDPLTIAVLDQPPGRAFVFQQGPQIILARITYLKYLGTIRLKL